ncbi:MAG TPA: VOC family protein [Firmicutes bacterium]|nr:VOC family protein [Bacillota bacterium]
MQQKKDSLRRDILGLHHISIKSRDLKKSLEFYHGLLGLKVRYQWADDSGQAVLLDAGDGNYIEIWSTDEAYSPGTGALIHFALRVDSIDSLLEKLRAGNIEITMDLTEIKIPAKVPLRAKIAFCKGPSGESIEFFQE